MSKDKNDNFNQILLNAHTKFSESQTHKNPFNQKGKPKDKVDYFALIKNDPKWEIPTKKLTFEEKKQ